MDTQTIIRAMRESAETTREARSAAWQLIGSRDGLAESVKAIRKAARESGVSLGSRDNNESAYMAGLESVGSGIESVLQREATRTLRQIAKGKTWTDASWIKILDRYVRNGMVELASELDSARLESMTTNTNTTSIDSRIVA